MRPYLAIPLTALTLSFLTACQTTVQKYRDLGISQYNNQQYDQSLASFQKALASDQFDARSNTYAGLLYYNAGHYEESVYHFKVALQSDPSSEQAKDGITASLIKLNKPDEALDYLERAAAMSEKVKDPRIEKTYSKRLYTKQTEERLFLGKAADELRIGRTYEKLGDYDNAMVYFKKALQEAPESANVLMALADLCEKAGNSPAARQYLAQAYLADPATPGIVDAMNRNNLAISDVIGPGSPRDLNDHSK